jgi:hypothetical protein
LLWLLRDWQLRVHELHLRLLRWRVPDCRREGRAARLDGRAARFAVAVMTVAEESATRADDVHFAGALPTDG